MKALALDTSISCIQIAAKNDDKIASLVLDIGMRQSEKLLPSIDFVLKQAELEPADLDYTALCQGPGSFTGLRLAFAALKAIELFGGKDKADQKAGGDDNRAQDQKAGGRSKIPLYGINSLDYFSQPFMDLPAVVVPVIDAHKEKFYAKAFHDGKEIIPCDDWDLRVFAEKLAAAPCDAIFACGLEANAFVDTCKENNLLAQKKLIAAKGRVSNFESLFILAEEKIAKNEPPLSDYDGPQYYRASEAELKHN